MLIPGIERTIAGKHVLLLNFTREAEACARFADLAALKRREPRGLVVAPHPYFPSPSCLWGLLDDHADMFDAVEVNAMFTESRGFQRAGAPLGAGTRQAACRQRRHPPPAAAGHHLFAGGCAADADAICAAIKAGRVQVEASPLSWADRGRVLMADICSCRAFFPTPAPARAPSAASLVTARLRTPGSPEPDAGSPEPEPGTEPHLQ